VQEFLSCSFCWFGASLYVVSAATDSRTVVCCGFFISFFVDVGVCYRSAIEFP